MTRCAAVGCKHSTLSLWFVVTVCSLRFSFPNAVMSSRVQRACAVLYCHLWHARLYHIFFFSHFLINGTIFGKKIIYHHHHHISVMELGNLLTRSCLTCPEVSSKVCHDSFCQLGISVSLPWVIYYGTFFLHVVSSFSCIPLICLKLVLFLLPLQFVHLI